jgi:hypothetical protein
MGAKTKATTAPSMTREQMALLNSMMRGVGNQMQGISLGQTWGGPGTTSRQGLGGTPWDTTIRPGQDGQHGMQFPYGQAISQAQPGGMPQAPIPSAAGFPATSPGPGAPPNPFGMAAYSDRNQIVSPIVNPFRRNLGG